MVKPAIKTLAIPGVLLLSVFFSMTSFVDAEIEKILHATSIYSDDTGIGLSHPEGVACNDGPFLVVADTRN